MLAFVSLSDSLPDEFGCIELEQRHPVASWQCVAFVLVLMFVAY
jgi:hypothetical protein